MITPEEILGFLNHHVLLDIQQAPEIATVNTNLNPGRLIKFSRSSHIDMGPDKSAALTNTKQ